MGDAQATATLELYQDYNKLMTTQAVATAAKDKALDKGLLTLQQESEPKEGNGKSEIPELANVDPGVFEQRSDVAGKKNEGSGV